MVSVVILWEEITYLEQGTSNVQWSSIFVFTKWNSVRRDDVVLNQNLVYS